MAQAPRQQNRAVAPVAPPIPQEVATADNPIMAAGFDPNGGPLGMQCMMKPHLLPVVQWLCSIYADSPVAPDHVKKNTGLVMWALDMSLTTNLHPNYILQCSFSPGGGKIGMMAEFVLAALRSSKAIKGDLEWDEVGDWSILDGKFGLVPSKNTRADGTAKGKVAEANYTIEDEQGLGVNVTVHWRDEDEPITYGPFLLSSCSPRFSTMWATNPLRQLKNVVTRRLIRHNRPDLIHGMPNADEDYDVNAHIGPDNAKDIGGNKSTEEKLNDIGKRGKKPVSAVAPGQNGNGNGDAPRVQLWMSDDYPAWHCHPNKIEHHLTEAITKAASPSHVNSLADQNAAVIQKLDADAQSRLEKVLSDRLDVFDPD